MDRRAMLRLLTAGAAWPLADQLLAPDLLAFGRQVHASVAADVVKFRALDPQAARTVTAACERIIPADETPGAVAAGVPGFIDHMLAEWYSTEDRGRFLKGLASLDDRSRAAHRKVFVDCSETQQMALLTAVDEEVRLLEKPAAAAGSDQIEALRRPTTADANAAAHWFRILKYLTIWGYCTSEVGMTEELRLFPQPTAYDGNATYERRRSTSRSPSRPGPQD